MYNMRIILFVNFFMAIYFSTMETEATKYFLHSDDDEITEQKAVEYLDDIEANEVLPLVLMLDKRTMELSPPEYLVEVFISFARLIDGTQFASKNKGTQTFFCPNLNFEENCLVAREFQETEELMCKKEFKPLVRKAGDNPCSIGNIGKPHTVLYEICPSRLPVNYYKTKEIPQYGLCFDANNQKTIFTSHTIGFPELLDAKALRPEHDIKYKMEATDEFIPSNIQELKDALDQEELNLSTTETEYSSEDENPETHKNKIQKLAPLQHQESAARKKSAHHSYSALPQDEDRMPEIPNYKIQKLTPPEDLAFASSRKSTYRFFNAALQHKTLFPLWNEMNEKIRNHAKKMYSNEGIRFSINTGVFDLTSAPREDGQKSNVWVKMIFASTGTIKDPMYGMVILMNNFIDKTAELSKPTEKSILDYCKDDRCEETLNQKFKEFGGRVRCCPMNEDFKALFRWQEITTDSPKPNNTEVQLLHIPGINGLDGGESSEMVE